MKSISKKPLSRRVFVKNSIIASTGTVLLSSMLSCSTDEEEEMFKPLGDFGFFEGVASFDPSQNQVILWTRYTPASNEEMLPEIILDVSTTLDFEDEYIIASSVVQADPLKDNTIHVDLSNLTSNTKYYYRFRNELSGAVSPIGQTKTLPDNAEVSDMKVAAVSCSNYQSGYFNVYAAITESTAELVIHLGDYIYESGPGGFGSNANTILLSRQHKPEKELIDLDDYRMRYKQYRSDPQLQELHRLKPFICVWDDHEIANNAHQTGAAGHQSSEGDYEQRKANALQAWHEYLPARVNDPTKIYRSFNLAGIVDLIMLDTRIVGRDQQLNYFNYFNLQEIDSQAFNNDWINSNRTILGAEQKGWLLSQINASTSPWILLGSQVLFGKYMIPKELLELATQLLVTPSIALFNQYQTISDVLSAIKQRILDNDPTVTNEERLRIETVLPYNLDAWDGYPIERDEILDAAANKKLISIAGDTHNAWHSFLRTNNGDKIGSEFATASVTAPGLEDFLGSNPDTLNNFSSSYELLIDDLKFFDVSQRGFIMLEFSNGSARCDWHFVNDIGSLDSSSSIDYSAEEN